MYIQDTSKIAPRWVKKHPLKYNNPLPTLNILYSNLQATLTIPSKYSQKYNKPPPFNKIKEVVQTAIDTVVGIFENIINWIKDNWQGLLLLIVNPFAGAFKLAYDNCEGFRNFVDGFIAKVKNGFKKGFEAVKDFITTPIEKA